MNQELESIHFNNPCTRRQFFKKSTAVAFSTAALAIENRLRIEGIRLDHPALTQSVLEIPQSINPINARVENVNAGIQQFGKNPVIFFDTKDPMFVPGSKYTVAHRAGNWPDDIEKAFKKNTQIFDIDANDVNGALYGEHGLLKQFFLKNLRLMIDVNEKELKLGLPRYPLETLFEKINSLSSPNFRLGAAIELKRGNFSIKTLSKLLALITEHDIPSIIFSNDINKINRLEAYIEKLYLKG